MPSAGNGIFSGYGRIVVHNGTEVYDIHLPDGTVSDLGPMTRPSWYPSESWSVWGVAEYFGGALYLDYRESGTQRIVRARVPDGVVTPIAIFSNLSDMASFVVSPSRNRWYFHHEYSSQFGGVSETLGYADAQFSVGGSDSTNPPAIISQPMTQSVSAGSTVTFSVGATGATPLAYQWRKNTQDIPGATNFSYTIPSAQSIHVGNYSVLVTNLFGSALSSNASLTLLPSPTNVLTDGNLRIVLWNAGGNIYSVQYQGVEIYRVGTYISDWGLQTGTNTATFVRNAADSTTIGQPMTLDASDGLSASYSGTYTVGGANVALITNQPVLTNGLLEVDGIVPITLPECYFRAMEGGLNEQPLQPGVVPETPSPDTVRSTLTFTNLSSPFNNGQ